MGEAVFLCCWLFSLKHPSTGVCRLLGGLISNEATYRAVLGKDYSLGRLSSVSCPYSESQPTPPSPGNPAKPVGRSGPDSCGVTALPWDRIHVKPCVCSLRMESLFTQGLWSYCTQDPLVFRAKCSGRSSSWCQTLMLGNLVWGSELSLLWEYVSDTVIFQFVGYPPSRCGIYSYHQSAPLAHCGIFFVFGCKIVFLVVASLFC